MGNHLIARPVRLPPLEKEVQISVGVGVEYQLVAQEGHGRRLLGPPLAWVIGVARQGCRCKDSCPPVAHSRQHQHGGGGQQGLPECDRSSLVGYHSKERARQLTARSTLKSRLGTPHAQLHMHCGVEPNLVLGLRMPRGNSPTGLLADYFLPSSEKGRVSLRWQPDSDSDFESCIVADPRRRACSAARLVTSSAAGAHGDRVPHID